MRNQLLTLALIATFWQSNLNCAATEATRSQLQPSQISQDDSGDFDIQYKKLTSFYKDETIILAFDLSQSNLQSFLAGTQAQGCIFGRLPAWETAYYSTLSEIAHSNWEKAREDLMVARIAETESSFAPAVNMPDVILLSAIINRAVKQNKNALGDLTELFELHKLAPSLWNESHLFPPPPPLPDEILEATSGYYQASKRAKRPNKFDRKEPGDAPPISGSH